MKPAVLVLLLLYLTFAVSAEETDYRKLLEDARLRLAYNPLDSEAQLELAYYHMMLGEADEALEQYRKLQQREPLLSAPAIGILWALNGKQDWKQSQQLGREFLANFPGEGLIHYYLAAAQAYDRKPHLARVGYLKAITLLEEPSLRALPEEGAGWAYLALDDYPAAARHFAHLEQPITPAPGKLAGKLSAGFAAKGASARFLNLGSTLSCRSWQVNLAAEEMLWEGKHFRWQIQAAARKQFPLTDLNLGLQYLDGKDERLYPGKSASLSLSPRIYARTLAIRPRLAQHFATWKRHNNYQTDLGVKLTYPPLSLNYTASRVYQDSEAPDSDSAHWVHSASASLRVWRDYWLGTHAGFGNLAFFATSAGSYIDDFEPGTAYYGLSLDAPLPGGLLLHLYQQLGIKDHDPVSFTSLGLSAAL